MDKALKIFVVLSLLCIVILFTRIKFAGVPPERDEGIYACIATGINQGLLPYRDIFDHKQPGVYLLYNLAFKLFGPGFVSVRLFTAIYVLLAMLAVFFAARAGAGDNAGLISAFIYTVLQSSVMLQGINSNTETFLSLPLAMSLFFVLSGHLNPAIKFFLSGLFLAFACLIKETVLPILIFMPVCLMICERPGGTGLFAFRNATASLAFFLGGFFVPLIMSAAILGSFGILNEYFECALRYNFLYAVSANSGYPGVNPHFIKEYIPVIVFALIPIFVRSKSALPYKSAMGLTYMTGIIAAIALQRGIQPHYYSALAAVASVAAGTALVWPDFQEKLNKYYAAVIGVLLTVFAAVFIISNSKFYGMTPYEVSNSQYGTGTFAEAAIISDIINRQKKPGDNVFVWNAEPEIYYQTNTRPPGRIYYVLQPYYDYDPVGVLRMIDTVFSHGPKFVVMPIKENSVIRGHLKNYDLLVKMEILSCWKLRDKSSRKPLLNP